MKDKISAFKPTQVMLAGDFEVYHYREPYFKPLDFHSHDFFELYLFLDGSVTYYIEEHAYDLIPGDLLVIPPGRMHRPVLSDSTALYERMVLWLNAGYLASLDDEKGTLRNRLKAIGQENGYLIPLRGEEFAFLSGLLVRLLALEKERTDWIALRQRALISTLLTTVCAEESRRDAADHEVPEKFELIPAVIRYINQHYTEGLTLDHLCGEFFVSKYHLIRKFKTYTNSTVYDYIISKRIALARKLLRQGLSAADAGDGCGFSDYSNFYKSFVKKTGMTPAQFKLCCRAPQDHTED